MKYKKPQAIAALTAALKAKPRTKLVKVKGGKATALIWDLDRELTP